MIILTDLTIFIYENLFHKMQNIIRIVEFQFKTLRNCELYNNVKSILELFNCSIVQLFQLSNRFTLSSLCLVLQILSKLNLSADFLRASLSDKNTTGRCSHFCWNRHSLLSNSNSFCLKWLNNVSSFMHQSVICTFVKTNSNIFHVFENQRQPKTELSDISIFTSSNLRPDRPPHNLLINFFAIRLVSWYILFCHSKTQLIQFHHFVPPFAVKLDPDFFSENCSKSKIFRSYKDRTFIHIRSDLNIENYQIILETRFIFCSWILAEFEILFSFNWLLVCLFVCFMVWLYVCFFLSIIFWLTVENIQYFC
jgi:hypothetical protein